MHNLRNPTGRLARWAIDLLEYDFDIVHRKRAMHHVPDASSRMFENERVEKLSVLELIEDEWYSQRREDVISSLNKYHGWKVVDDRLYTYRSDPLLEDLMDDLNAWKLVVPKNYRAQILIESHEALEAGHLGTEKTYHRAAIQYYWPGMYKDITAFVRKCVACQLNKPKQAQSRGIMTQRIVQQPWSVVATDIMGPFPRSKRGFEYIVLFQDLFTKWSKVEPLRAINAKKIMDSFLDVVIIRWGTPEVLHSDNGTEYNNNLH